MGNDFLALLWPHTASFTATESTSGSWACTVGCAYLFQDSHLASRELGCKSYVVPLHYLRPEED